MSRQNKNSNGKGKKPSARDKAWQRRGGGTPPPFPEQDIAKTKRQRRDEEVDNEEYRSRSNPVQLYKNYPAFSKDAATLPFATPLGQILTETFTHQVTGEVTAFQYAVPGIMRLRFSPSIGVSSDFTSPANRSSIRFYSYLRSVMKAKGDYDHQDISMMVYAIDSCIMLHSLGRRVVAMMQNWTPVNEYYPNALIAACGFVPSDLRQNLQDFRQWLNTFAFNLQQYALPKGIDLFNRHAWMCEGIYVDGESSKAQTYIFVPTGFWKYNNTVASGSQLEFVYYLDNGGTTQHTVKEFMALGDSLVNAISNDNDFADISGDMYTFYGGNQYTLPYIDENYKILPSYDKVVLSQIENATIMGNFAADYTPVISQNPAVNEGAIIYEPRCQGEYLIAQHSMNFHWESPTSDDVLEASRLMCTSQLVKVGETNEQVITSTGTEILHAIDIVAVNPATHQFRFNPIYNSVFVWSQDAPASVVLNEIADIISLANFDWAPRIQMVNLSTSVTTNAYLGSTWDIDNMSVIPDEYLAQINTACLYSLLNIADRSDSGQQ